MPEQEHWSAFDLREYKPKDTESVEIEGEGTKTAKIGEPISVLTFNTGYGALDAKHDFFMDGGSDVNADSEEQIRRNLEDFRYNYGD